MSGFPRQDQFAIPLAQKGAPSGVAALSAASHVIGAGADLSGPVTFTPTLTPQEYWVTKGTLGSDANDGSQLAPFATIGAALTAAAGAPCVINAGFGTWTYAVADSNGNGGWTLTTDQHVIGKDKGLTTFALNLAAQVVWGFKLTGAQASIEKCSITVAGTSPYFVYGVGGPASFSAESCKFVDVLGIWSAGATITAPPGGTSVMPPAFGALAPDNPGSYSMDVALSVFERCSVYNNSGSATLAAAYVVGNNTGGNVLANEFHTCVAVTCAYGVASGGSGFLWTGGSMSGNTTIDFYVTQGGGDPVTIRGGDYENGNTFFFMGGIGPVAPVLLDNPEVRSYTPTYSAYAHTLIEFDTQGTIVMLGGSYATTAGNTVIKINANGAAYVNTLVALGVCLDNAAGWPAANAVRYQRFIMGATYIVATIPTPNPAFAFVVDGANGIVTAPTADLGTFAAAISAGVQNTLGYDILVTGSIDYTAALAGATFTIGVDNDAAPTLVSFATVSVVGAGQAYFSAYVPAGFYLGLGSTGTITPGAVTAVGMPI